MQRKEFTILNKLGLHARAAALLVKTASAFTAEIHVGRDDLRVNGKSIMGVLLLAASQGSTIWIETGGDDEEDAMQAIGELINNGFGELEP
ncbi:MAG: HPr family phosphocarrier protein [Deltaproteobacteria bacterium]|nr:HPr family phosphocarrier protein [Candidatus Anaeroferrophillus wilburensis]MBN2889468.1 HPr family phosphocarrier protein [Deltaproteobacteria bacterium]